jgi:hypothetical protein
MADRLSPNPDDDTNILWHGRPDVGLRMPDVNAAGLAFLATLVVLAPGLAAQNDWSWAWAARLGATYAALVGVLTAFGRVAGAGLRLTLGTAFFAVVTAASFSTTQQGLALLCPLSCLCVTGTLLGMSYRRRRATRYQLTREKALVGESDRYVIAFPVDDLPAVKSDLFGGSLAAVEFGEVDATLTTRNGKVFRVSSQVQTFRRILNPERLLEAIERIKSL